VNTNERGEPSQEERERQAVVGAELTTATQVHNLPHGGGLEGGGNEQCDTKKNGAKNIATSTNVNTSTSSSSQLYRFAEEKQRISLSKERRAARTMAIIMGAFVICWLPFFLMYIIFPFCTWCVEHTDSRVVNFFVWLGYFNSTLNPIIYTVFNVDYRRAFQNLLTGKCHLIR